MDAGEEINNHSPIQIQIISDARMWLFMLNSPSFHPDSKPQL